MVFQRIERSESSIEEKFEGTDIAVSIPPLYLCTDNAAMIGAAASIQYHKDEYAKLDLNAQPGLMIEKVKYVIHSDNELLWVFFYIDCYDAVDNVYKNVDNN